MKRIEKRIMIDAPVEQVFEYLTDVTHLPEIWPSMVEVKDVTPAAVGGYNYNWIYKMVGVRLNGKSEMVEYDHHKRTVVKSSGGIESTFTWNFTPKGDRTEVHVTIDYRVPIPVLGKLAEGFILKANENEADTFLANYKAALETQAITAS